MLAQSHNRDIDIYTYQGYSTLFHNPFTFSKIILCICLENVLKKSKQLYFLKVHNKKSY
ncbi:hypothetical protein FORC84_p005 (plasmid) [Campylobacter jejuni]|nr:hypothetical protein FORC84_p005 [Campylobacter jejuni]